MGLLQQKLGYVSQLQLVDPSGRINPQFSRFLYDLSTTLIGPAGGDLTGTFPNPIIGLNKVTYAKFQQASATTLIGNPTGSPANVEEITLDASLTFTGTTLKTVSAPPSGAAGGDLTGTYPNPTVSTNKVTYAKFQQASATTLIGNPTGSPANVEEITLGPSLSFSGTTLNTVTAAPSGAAGGDLNGNYPNPGVAKINGVTLGTTTATSGHILIGSGSAWVTNAISGDATLSSTGGLTLASTGVSASTYTYMTGTVDVKGRLTAASSGTTPLIPSNNLNDVSSETTSWFNLMSNGYPNQSISSITTLSTTSFGKEVICTGSTAYTVTLPSVTSNAERFIDFSIRTTSNALITITPASGTIMGQSTFILGSNEGCRVVTDGTNWYVTNLTLQPVNCRAYQANSQSIAPSTAVKVKLDSITYAIGSFFDNVTNYRYTPLYPGKYLVSGAITWNVIPDGYAIGTYLYKNGSLYSLIDQSTGTSSNPSALTTDIISMNGSTDYLELWGVQTTGSSVAPLPGASFVWASFARISNF